MDIQEGGMLSDLLPKRIKLAFSNVEVIVCLGAKFLKIIGMRVISLETGRMMSQRLRHFLTPFLPGRGGGLVVSA